MTQVPHFEQQTLISREPTGLCFAFINDILVVKHKLVVDISGPQRIELCKFTIFRSIDQTIKFKGEPLKDSS